MKNILNQLLVLTLLVVTSAVTVAAEKKIPLLVVYDSDALQVNLFKEEDKTTIGISALFGMLGGVVAGGVLESRNNDLAEQLQQTIGDELDREAMLLTSLNDVFSSQTEFVKITPIKLAEAKAKKLLKKGKPNYNALKKSGYRYLLIVSERAGYSTPSNALGQLDQSSMLKSRLYDLKKRRVLFKENVLALEGTGSSVELALSDKEGFVKDYARLQSASAVKLYFRLLGTDSLHSMAKKYGLKSQFPSFKTTLKEYKKKHQVSVYLPDGWIKLKSNNDFMHITAPESDQAVIGIIDEIDVLVEGLGQDFDSLDEYVDVRLSRLLASGVDISSLQKEIPELELDEQWLSYMLDDPRGGKVIILHRLVGDFAINYQVILLGNDYMSVLEKHKLAIEQSINQTKFRIKSGS